MKQAMVLVTICSCALLSACGDSATIWSAQAESPNGHLIATAQTIQNGGPGTASVDTAVYLKQPKSSQPPLLIVGFTNESAYPSGITAVQLHWQSNSQLDITYKSGATIDFQAIKALGADIAVHEVDSH
jgi:hypothetical protein